jgi:hypothetical protein
MMTKVFTLNRGSCWGKKQELRTNYHDTRLWVCVDRKRSGFNK